jgi:hypothetical protein
MMYLVVTTTRGEAPGGKQCEHSTLKLGGEKEHTEYPGKVKDPQRQSR